MATDANFSISMAEKYPFVIPKKPLSPPPKYALPFLIISL